MSTRQTLLSVTLAMVLFPAVPHSASAQHYKPEKHPLCGTLVDYTHNGPCDHRLYSNALCAWRDLYVYLPPGYDSKTCYPFMVWLHGYMADECQGPTRVLEHIDQAIASGKLPPMIVAFPDGSLNGRSHYIASGSWWVNSRRGQFADYVMQDVIPFIEQNYSVSRDRRGRLLVGWSMGGFGAYNLALRHPDKFSVVAATSAPLNLRYMGCCGDYFEGFDPDCQRMREQFHGHEVVGRFFCGLIRVRAWQLVRPVFGRGSMAVQRISEQNPIEVLERTTLQPGQFEMYVAYGKHDEMNLDAHIESFVHAIRQRKVEITVDRFPEGNHSEPFLVDSFPYCIEWLQTRVKCPDCPAHTTSGTAAPK